MNENRKLALRKETLTELSGPELLAVAGAAAASGLPCAIDLGPTASCVTCVDTLTVATCQCPTGPTCVCPTDFGCA